METAGYCLPIELPLLGSTPQLHGGTETEGEMKTAGYCLPIELPLLGSNQDSSDPESDVLPVTPRGSGNYCVESLYVMVAGLAT